MVLPRPGAETLRRAPAFRSLSDADCDAVLVCSLRRTFAPGEVVFEEGDPGSVLLLVVEGTLVATARGSAGTSRELARIGPGEAAGAVAFLDARRREATVTATTAATGYEIDYDAVDVLLRNAPAAACAVMRLALGSVAARLAELEDAVGREERR